MDAIPIKRTPAFDATSQWFCDICHIDVKIGLRGESNWTTHLKSGPHIRAQGPSSSVIEPARLSSTTLVPLVQTEIANTPDIIMIDDEHDGGRQAPYRSGSVIDQLRGFSGSPFVDPNEYKDSWEMVTGG
ncbi:hypothetical protein PILCRDRAFT_10042 [Piloderma croceum F 1598]|uniref:Uncharacterized protein n=1 Tax=Piloderma croceum (strain F 1598) TaxID=765440 RepID=A0A0C3F595_PILCF|nr:hypothetical protein PILCRDRAFT_10042 [Piloderma croceum F 1598]